MPDETKTETDPWKAVTKAAALVELAVALAVPVTVILNLVGVV